MLGCQVEATLNRKCAHFKRGSKIFRLDLINETALCYLWPLVKELDRVCVWLCMPACALCVCVQLRDFLSAYTHFNACVMCLSEQRLPSYHVCFTALQPFTGRPL